MLIGDAIIPQLNNYTILKAFHHCIFKMTSRSDQHLLRKGMIIGMGNSMLDLIGNVCAEVLDQYSLKANNGYLAEEHHMSLFKELKEKYNAKYVVGGSAQNSLRVAQWVLSEPKICIVMGAIGRDEEGNILVKKANEDGVDTQYQYIDNVPTGVCAVLLTKNGAERTLVANLSAANHFSTDHLLKPEIERKLREADILYITGFLLSVNVEAILHTIQATFMRRRWFAMNLSASFLAERYMKEWNKVIPYVDILFGNETEARTFAKEKEFGDSTDIHKIAVELSVQPKAGANKGRIVVITQGHDPVIVVKDGILTEYPVIELSPESLVDTTGAGDAFVGGFLAQFVQAGPMEECVSCGIWCATQMVMQQGCSLEGLVKYSPSTTCTLSS